MRIITITLPDEVDADSVRATIGGAVDEMCEGATVNLLDRGSEIYVLEPSDWAARYDSEEGFEEMPESDFAEFERKLADEIGSTLDEISELTWQNGARIFRELKG